MFNGIDLSSDTATKPAQSMLNAMITAKVGDEQKREDPTTNALEALVAEKFGFDYAIFLPSATMANQIAIQCLCEPGNELIAAANSHLFQSETGGPAIHANVMCKPIFTSSGIFTPDDIQQQFHWAKSVRNPISKLISVENTSNFGGGTAWNKNELDNILHCAKKLNLKLHMDGARLFNASIKTGLSVKEICDGFDTVSICLSKGLGCPVGALLAFNSVHEIKIRRLKHLMGGAMRQSGILAAAGIYALEHNIERLTDDHKNATNLANELSQIPSIQVLNNSPATNIVLFRWDSPKMTASEFHKKCIQLNVRFSEINNNTLRAVTHLDISTMDIEKTIKIIKAIAE